MKENFDSLRNWVYIVDPYGIKELGMLIINLCKEFNQLKMY